MRLRLISFGFSAVITHRNYSGSVLSFACQLCLFCFDLLFLTSGILTFVMAAVIVSMSRHWGCIPRWVLAGTVGKPAARSFGVGRCIISDECGSKRSGWAFLRTRRWARWGNGMLKDVVTKVMDFACASEIHQCLYSIGQFCLATPAKRSPKLCL